MAGAHAKREDDSVMDRVPTPALDERDGRDGEGSADRYRPQPPFLDELFEPDGTPRPTAVALVEQLQRLGPAGLVEAGRRRDAIFMRQGITFETGSADDASHERPFPLDLVPRVLSGQEWRDIKRGLAQRIRALNHFVDDVYHAREIVREGLVPWRLVVSCSHFARAVHGIRPPGGVYTHVAGCDLVRHSDGTWKVIEDNVRIPSGISYVLENRAAMARLVPELFASYRVRPVEHYPQLLLRALRSVAPSAEAEATVVVWTPGPANPAYFEHAFLARQMGVELVEASDLVVRDDVLYMRTTRGLERAHAVYRRIDDDFVDPLEFRGDSLLGVPGLIRAYRAGSVAIANAFGTGVADDKAIYCFVPEMIRFYLGEEPILENVKTYLLSEPEVLEHVLERLDQLVVKPTGESGGRGVMIGPHATDAEIERMRDVVSAHPDRWIAQDVVRLSTVPTVCADGTLAPRHVDLRPFAVFGERIDIVPGGLDARRARRGLADRQLLARRRLEGHLGAGGRRHRRPRRAADRRHAAARAAGSALRGLDRAAAATAAGRRRLMLARIAHELYWLGRNLARAEFTARAVEAVFQAELQGASDATPGVSFGSGGLLAMFGDVDESSRSRQALGQLTLDAERPGSMLASFERAREGARTVRDVISAEMWEAINTTALGLRGGGQPGWTAPAGPYLASQYVKERTALIWGVANRSMLRDEAKCFLDAGGLIEISDMVLRMLRIAMPQGDPAPADGQALILLQAVGGFHAYLRAVTAPPNAHPVARFLLFERAYPDSVAACVDSLNDVFTMADAGPRNSKPVLRVSRLAADLDFQRRALPDGAELTDICEQTQQELARIDQDVAERYFAGAAAAGLRR